MQTVLQKSNKPLKYLGHAIVCGEVPDEISLAFNISGCPYKCEGCHSTYLWEYEGNYLSQDFKSITSELSELITCVCFLGGDQNMMELETLLKKVKYDYGLKTCLYTGEDDIRKFDSIITQGLLDYLKTGRYMADKGGLNSKNTNQKMYKIFYYDNNWNTHDITYRFQK